MFVQTSDCVPVCVCIILARWHVYLRVHWRLHSQVFAFMAVLVSFHKPWPSPRTAVLQPSFGSGSPGVWPPSPVLSHFASTLGIQLLWKNQRTTPKSFQTLKREMWQDPEQWLADSFPCISRDGWTRTFSSQDTNDTAAKSLNINKSELVGSELLETMGSHPFLHFPTCLCASCLTTWL